MIPHLRRFAASQALFAEVAAQIDVCAHTAIADHGTFYLALAGGNTPRALYNVLAQAPYRERSFWSATEVFFGDERCVGPDHAASNFRMAQSQLLRHLPIPAERIHRMRCEHDPAHAASHYIEALRRLPTDAGGRPVFDLILLGMGADGHIASLFPGTAALAEGAEWVTAVYVDRLQSWRVTLTLPVLNAARNVFLLVTGGDKAEAVDALLARAAAPADSSGPACTTASAALLPVQRLHPAGEFRLYADAAAAPPAR